MANDKLSRAASAMLAYHQTIDAGAEEVALLHAPSECMVLIVDWEERKLNEQLSALGFTRRSLAEAVEARTTSKFAYELGA